MAIGPGDIYGIDVAGLDDFRRVLDFAREAVDIDRVLDEGGAILLNRIKARYLEQESPDGEPWEPSQAAIDRAVSGRDGGTLFDTGTLFQSIQAARVGDEVVIGTDVFYSIFHNEGTRDLPQREFLGFSDDDVAVIERLILSRLRPL